MCSDLYLKLKFAAPIADVKKDVLEKLKHLHHQLKVENRAGQIFRAEGLFCRKPLYPIQISHALVFAVFVGALRCLQILGPRP